jgi:inward rectifier potassium channel
LFVIFRLVSAIFAVGPKHGSIAAMASPAKPPKRKRRPRTVIRTTTMGGPGGMRLISDEDRRWRDLYHGLFTTTWAQFFGLFAAVYIFFNLVFACVYLIDPRGIANAHPGSFGDAFFFSVQTMATVGFGDMHPQDLFTNIVVTIEVLLGITTIAIATALIFSRFSRPTARVMFSDIAVVAPYDGVPTLMFRAANRRRNQILEAQVSVSVLRDEITAEGKEMRRFHDLALSRARTPMFSLSWTVMHPIVAGSPLFGATAESMAAQDARIVVTMTGIDETFSATIHARNIYPPDAIIWNRRFVDILGESDDGVPTLDYRRFNQVEPV